MKRMVMTGCSIAVDSGHHRNECRWRRWRKVLRLYREVYSDFNVSHFVDKLHEEHEIDLSYSWVKKALQEADLVARASHINLNRGIKTIDCSASAELNL